MKVDNGNPQNHRILQALRIDHEDPIEVFSAAETSVELDIRDPRFVSTQHIHDRFVSVRFVKKGSGRFVSLPGDASLEDIRRSMKNAEPKEGFAPFAAKQVRQHRNNACISDEKRLLNNYIQRLTQKDSDEEPWVNDITIRTRRIDVANSFGADIRTYESYVAFRYDVLEHGLGEDGNFCFPTAYAEPGKLPSNQMAVRHSGKFRPASSLDDRLLLIQADVAVELMATWTQRRSAESTVKEGNFSDALSMSETAPFHRVPHFDDIGRKIAPRWLVRKGRCCTNRIQPQGAYRKKMHTPPEAMWNVLSLHPSKRTLTELLTSIHKGFYISRIAGLVFEKDFQEDDALYLRFEGFDICNGKIVGEPRWVDRPISFSRLFQSVIAVDHQLYYGRWKWADGWYASPSILVRDLFQTRK